MFCGINGNLLSWNRLRDQRAECKRDGVKGKSRNSGGDNGGTGNEKAESGTEEETDESIFLAEAVAAITAELRTDSDVCVRIWGADEKKGLLGMEVEEMFRYPNGREGRVSYSRTAILDKEKDKKGSHTVKFYWNKEDMQADADCYKSFVVADGEKIKEPCTPKADGMVFEGWHDWNDYIADFSQEVQEDIVYYGAWSK